MTPQLASSLATGGASLLGGIFGSAMSLRATRETNAQNYKIWQEQQQHNIDMFNMQNQANIDMWNMQNAYNDPSQQVARLSAAGLNPYLAMQGGNSAGVATNAPAAGQIQSPQAPQMQAPPSEAFDIGIGTAVDRALQAYSITSQSELNDANIRNILEMLPYNKDYVHAGTQHKLADTDLMKALKSGQDIINYINEETSGFKIQQEQWLAAKLMAENSLLGLQKEHQEILNKYLPSEKALTCAQIVANILSTEADIEVKYKQARLFLAKAIGQENINKVTEATIDDLIFTTQMELFARQTSAGLTSSENKVYQKELDQPLGGTRFLKSAAYSLRGLPFFGK
ncbi:MAG: DNA pilot protein [Microviridae sp.]|nr:MAG: DNA pilot protein [Microviridae sp.]